MFVFFYVGVFGAVARVCPRPPYSRTSNKEVYREWGKFLKNKCNGKNKKTVLTLLEDSIYIKKNTDLV